MQTLDDRFQDCKGVGPGFYFLRISLSLLILLWHCFGLAWGLEWVAARPVSPLLPLQATLVPMFFALSGVLVMGSAIRLNSLRTFITFRVLRVVPALVVEVSLSALIFGPLFTVLPLRRYFSSVEFFEYFGSFIGRVRYVLPGVFLDNPLPHVVNGALWTIGPEIMNYTILAVLIITGTYRRRRAMLALTIAFVVFCLLFDRFDPLPMHENLPKRLLTCAVLFGNLVYLWRDRLPFSPSLALGVFALSVLAIGAVQLSIGPYALIYPAVLGLSYFIAIIGFSAMPALPWFDRGDYSYGIYLYGYPIQQALVHVFPHQRTPLFVLASALPLTLLCAVGSWHLVEKPALDLRKHLLPRQRPPANEQATAPGWTLRKTGITAVLVGYGAFVAFSSGVFPLRSAANYAFGWHLVASAPVGPQF